jgi:hypothetical protein
LGDQQSPFIYGIHQAVLVGDAPDDPCSNLAVILMDSIASDIGGLG